MRQVIFDPWIASHQRPNGALFSVNSSILPDNAKMWWKFSLKQQSFSDINYKNENE